MANRPVFVVQMNTNLFKKENIDFTFYSGFSEKQQRKSINSLHHEFICKNKNMKALEISSKSENDLGVKLSAFNLMIKTKCGKDFSVESAFQASKVFEKGGPYLDLLYVSSKIAKKDERLKNSGKIISFKYAGRGFQTEPKTYFYNWLYVNALYLHPEIYMKMVDYDAFTDIAFNPQKSINCQAEAAAIFVSLYRQNMLSDAVKDKESFLKVVYPDFNNEKNHFQTSLF